MAAVLPSGRLRALPGVTHGIGQGGVLAVVLVLEAVAPLLEVGGGLVAEFDGLAEVGGAGDGAVGVDVGAGQGVEELGVRGLLEGPLCHGFMAPLILLTTYPGVFKTSLAENLNTL